MSELDVYSVVVGQKQIGRNKLRVEVRLCLRRIPGAYPGSCLFISVANHVPESVLGRDFLEVLYRDNNLKSFQFNYVHSLSHPSQWHILYHPERNHWRHEYWIYFDSFGHL